MTDFAKTSGEKITIEDIARASNVSKATVSHFLNHQTSFYSEATGDRIRKIIEEMNHNPSKAAQRLKASRTGLIGCCIGDIGSPFAGLLLKGISSMAESHGHQVLFSQCDNDPKKERMIIDGLLSNRVDGLIVNTSGGNDEYLISVDAGGVPVALADRGLLGRHQLDTVEFTNEETAFDCVKFLKNIGHEKIAFFTQSLSTIRPRIDRYQGYCRAISLYFPDDGPVLVEVASDTEQDWMDACLKFIRANPGKRIAALSSNGVTAQLMMVAMNRVGYEFGHDFGLCTFDDWSWMKISATGITSVTIPTEKIGATTAELLINKIESKDPVRGDPNIIRLPGNLNIRGSTSK